MIMLIHCFDYIIKIINGVVHMIGKNIKMLREKKGLKQEDIAKLLHVKPSIINLWESGNGIPTIQFVLQLAKVFDVTCDEILLGKTELLNIDQLTDEHKEKVRIIYNSFLKLNNEKRKNND